MIDVAPFLTRHDVEAKLVKRCWEDEEFRREFTADPVSTAAKYLQVPVASLPKIVIHEEPAGSWHMVLPPKPSNANELSEEDLEKVAGGITPTISWAITATASAASVGAGVSLSVTGSAMISIDKGW